MLTKERNEIIEKTYYYTYDPNGNLTDIACQPFPLPGVVYPGGSPPYDYVDSFVYQSTGWKDQIGYSDRLNGPVNSGMPFVFKPQDPQAAGWTEWEYDEIGNPVMYKDMTFTWQYGRKLTEVSRPGKDISYTYGTDGARLSKTVNGLKTTYTVVGGVILQEKNSNYELNYYYDATGSLVSIGYKANGASTETYYFVTRNAQGDILSIYNSANSTLIGTYMYNAWGINEGISFASADPNGIMEKNPFRYRGYYFDKETDFYYLKTRYYDPQLCRFINADGLISTGQGVLGYNMYAYCNNNPVNLSDSNGTRPIEGFNTKEPGKFTSPSGNISQPKPVQNSVSNVVPQNVTTAVTAAVMRDEPIFAASSLLTSAMARSAWFALQVGNGRQWDIKRQGPWERTIGTVYPGADGWGADKEVIFWDEIVTLEDIGNITYGYLGSAAGFSKYDLLKGGDFAAGGKDSPEDKANIIKGISWYNNR